MRFPHHLRRSRHGVFHFRFAIPARLRAIVGQCEIKRSLNTREPREALRLAYNFSLLIKQTLKRAEEAIRDMKPDQTPDLTNLTAELRKLIGQHPDLSAEYRELMVRVPGGIELIAEPGNAADIADLHATLEKFKSDPRIYALIEKHAEAELAALKKGRLQPTGEAATVVMATPAISPDLRPIRYSQGIDEYLVSLASKTKKTQQKYHTSLLHFQNWLQTSVFSEKDPYVHEIGTDHIQKWKDVLVREAKERAKGKQAKKAARGQLNEDPAIAGMDPKIKLGTVDNYIGVLNAFFGQMQKNKRYPANMTPPTSRQNLRSRKEKMRYKGWNQFSDDELLQVFSVANYKHLEKPHEYWFPLIALLTGARREEIAQLTYEDIRQEDGIWIIDINDEDFRKVKTAAGVRIIPLHPVLIELGLLDYVAAVREVSKGVKRIFPYLRYDKSNGFGDVPGEAFARYLDRLGIHDETKVLHSLRKNANDRLSKNGVDEPKRCRMVGHDHDSVNVQSYTDGISIAMLATEVVPKLTFPKLCLEALRRPVEAHKQLLINEIAAAKKRHEQQQRRQQVKAAKEQAAQQQTKQPASTGKPNRAKSKTATTGA